MKLGMVECCLLQRSFGNNTLKRNFFMYGDSNLISNVMKTEKWSCFSGSILFCTLLWALRDGYVLVKTLHFIRNAAEFSYLIHKKIEILDTRNMRCIKRSAILQRKICMFGCSLVNWTNWQVLGPRHLAHSHPTCKFSSLFCEENFPWFERFFSFYFSWKSGALSLIPLFPFSLTEDKTINCLTL